MDKLLLRLLNARDEHERQQRLDALLTMHVAPIIRHVLRQRLGLYVNAQGINANNHDAEDLYQEAMTRIVEVLNTDQLSLTKIESFEPYVAGIVSNLCVDFLRSKHRTREQQFEFETNSSQSTRSAESDVETHELLARLWPSVTRLTPRQRDAFALRFQDQNGRVLFTVLLAAGIVGWKDLAEGMGRSVADLTRLWRQMPMDTATAASELHTSRENIYKWRYRAIQKLKGELK